MNSLRSPLFTLHSPLSRCFRIIVCLSLLFNFQFSILNFQFSTLRAQCPQALMHYAEKYPAAEPQDLYKLVFQDLYGPGHLLTDSADCVRYLTAEINQMPTRSPLSNSQFSISNSQFPLYEYTLCDSNFVRVNLILVKEGVIPLHKLVSALMRSAQGLPSPDPKFVMTHSTPFKQAYNPHYRIVRRDIFEKELQPIIDKKQ